MKMFIKNWFAKFWAVVSIFDLLVLILKLIFFEKAVWGIKKSFWYSFQNSDSTGGKMDAQFLLQKTEFFREILYHILFFFWMRSSWVVSASVLICSSKELLNFLKQWSRFLCSFPFHKQMKHADILRLRSKWSSYPPVLKQTNQLSSFLSKESSFHAILKKRILISSLLSSKMNSYPL